MKNLLKFRSSHRVLLVLLVSLATLSWMKADSPLEECMGHMKKALQDAHATEVLSAEEFFCGGGILRGIDAGAGGFGREDADFRAVFERAKLFELFQFF
jgi:hypothetical protein